MEKRKVDGMFDVDINKLPEVKNINEILNNGEAIEDYYSPVKCTFTRRSFKMKDGSMSEPQYHLFVNLGPNMEEEIKNRKIINANEWNLICMALLKPIDASEIKFTGYVRFLRGLSDKIIGNDKSFTILDLFIHEDLTPVNSFFSNGSKLVLNRFSSMTDEERKVLKVEKVKNFKQFKLSNTSVVDELNNTEVSE